MNLSNFFSKTFFNQNENNEWLTKQMLVDAEKMGNYDESYTWQQVSEKLNLNTTEKPIRNIAYRWVAAASVLLIVGLGIFYFYPKFSTSKNSLANAKTDILSPSTSKAYIKKSDGTIISIQNIDAQNQEYSISKNGELSINNSVEDIAINQVINPAGSTVLTFILSDGTKVWLNAATTISYPLKFTGKERKVMVNGEAYFEVAHNPNQPFIVSDGKTEAVALGTQFNFNSYNDEQHLKITLVEGKVKVNQQTNSALLHPGQQAVVLNDIMVKNVDVSEVVAWKNNLYQFNNTSLRDVMKQLSRNYNIEVSYSNGCPDINFSGKVKRNISLSQLLQVLDFSRVKFEINGNKILIKQ